MAREGLFGPGLLKLPWMAYVAQESWFSPGVPIWSRRSEVALEFLCSPGELRCPWMGYVAQES